ncbi:MAG: cell wall anchor protein [Muribaculaceae bacterium]|nr:cell wall anchor protein [Muribaculaceae bacterium]
MRIKRYRLLIAAAIVGMGVAAGNVTVKAKLDSTQLLMGRVTALHLEIVQDQGTRGVLLQEKSDTLTSMVEIADKPKADTVSLGNNREQINRDLILQAFDSGLYVLPPVAYVVGRDTFESNPLSLKVLPVPVDTTQDIIGIKPVEGVPFKLFDWVPDFISDYWWAWLAGLALIAFGIFAYYHWYKKGINPLKPVKKRLPPYEEAMLALTTLKSRNLWQNGQEKEYFTGLTDILRVYIDRRFGINAVEMTSSQIMDKIKQNKEAHIANDQLKEVLEIADFVKFAKMHTLADDNEIAYQRAVNFVEATKPVPQVDETGKEAEQ